jgi:hypothetical protein
MVKGRADMIRIGSMTLVGVALPFCASLLLGAVGGCAEGNRGKRQFAGHLDEVEISPGRFLTIQRRKNAQLSTLNAQRSSKNQWAVTVARVLPIVRRVKRNSD